jgi:hypothetical protein
MRSALRRLMSEVLDCGGIDHRLVSHLTKVRGSFGQALPREARHFVTPAPADFLRYSYSSTLLTAMV